MSSVRLDRIHEGVFLRKDNDEHKIIVLILPESNYSESIESIIKDVSKIEGLILYVTLNRPYSSLVSTFNKLDIDIEKIHFIDAITRTAIIPDESDRCDYVSSPTALTDLSVTISKLMDTGKYKFLFFDSLSTLLVYESDTTIAKFVHFLMVKVRVAGCNAIFTCLSQDKETLLIKDINMFADSVIEY